MKKVLTGFDLKVIGIIFMVIDHVKSYLGTFIGLPAWVSLLGRFVAPLFVFLMIEGFHHTRDRKKYFIRLFIGGILMYGINIVHNLLIKNSFTNPYTGEFDIFSILQGQNIFMTLALLMLFIWGIDVLRYTSLKFGKKTLLVLGLLLLLPFIFISEGGIYELIMGLIFYFFRGNLKKITIAVMIFTVILFSHTMYNYFSIEGIGTLCQVLTFSNEYMMITVLPFIYLYNGKRGGNGSLWQKELFYYFYPIHLIIIYLLQDKFLGII
ncbi:TraX family protein [Enterococcus faecalis]|uniref:TraX family protein n=1 Tax=Enterococcus faecalis TaxID=1351 RepID=UPI00338F100C